MRKDGSKFHYAYDLHISDENYPLAAGLQWAENTDSDEEETADDTSERSRHAIKSITYPEGAKVSYQYVPLEQCAFTAKITVSNSSAKKTCRKNCSTQPAKHYR